jgi:hypothetical protein
MWEMDESVELSESRGLLESNEPSHIHTHIAESHHRTYVHAYTDTIFNSRRGLQWSCRPRHILLLLSLATGALPPSSSSSVVATRQLRRRCLVVYKALRLQ